MLPKTPRSPAWRQGLGCNGFLWPDTLKDVSIVVFEQFHHSQVSSLGLVLRGEGCAVNLLWVGFGFLPTQDVSEIARNSLLLQ